MHPSTYSLADLGWTSDFLRQMEPEEIGAFPPARVAAVHRDRINVLSEAGPMTLLLPPDLSAGDIAVGDWVLVDPSLDRVARLLDRKSRFFRRAAGDVAREQLIVANVDTVFITTSCNADFNEARLERYLALAHAGGVPPVVLLTKADTCDEPEVYVDRLRDIAPAVPALTLNARDSEAVKALRAWCGRGNTVAFLGSSGVGKSTLISALTDTSLQTAAIREDDAKGRHTTTARSLHPLEGGGWLIDTPGMREIRLTETAEGIDETFAEISELIGECRFSNCLHETEPGCAVRAAIEAGTIDPARLARWQKLRREDEWNSASVAQLRRKSRDFAKMVKRSKRDKSGSREA